jgi:alpha-1,2-mannosyltransferase
MTTAPPTIERPRSWTPTRGQPGGVTTPPTVLVVAVLAAALLAVWWHGPLLDLHIYRLGGLSARHGGDDLYSLRDTATGLPFTYTPFAALLFAPLAAISEQAAEVLITVLSVAAAVRLSGLIIEQMNIAARQRSRAAGTILILLTVSEPVISTLLFGQINLILFMLAAEAMLRPHSRWAAIGLGIATGIKLTPAIFILGLFVCGRWREGCKAAAAAAGTMIIGVIYLGRPSVTFFSGDGFQDTRIGGTSYISNQSINGLLWRLTGPGGQHTWWVVLAAIVLVVALWTARVFAARTDQLSAMASVALAGLLISPVSWSHHWIGATLITAALFGHRRRLIAAGCWLLVTSSWVIWMVPHGHNVEYHQSLTQGLLGNAYVELGLATLLVLAIRAVRLQRTCPLIAAAPPALRLVPDATPDHTSAEPPC